MNLLALVRSPLLRVGVLGLALAGAYYGGVRTERARQSVADARAGEESAIRRTAQKLASERARAAVAAAEVQAGESARLAAEADARAVQAEAVAKRSAATLAAARRQRQAVESNPDASPEARHGVVVAQADACDVALADEQAAHLETRTALREERKAHADTRLVVVTLKDALAGETRRADGLELDLEASRAREFKLEARSHRRGKRIAILVTAVVVGGLAASQ